VKFSNFLKITVFPSTIFKPSKF